MAITRGDGLDPWDGQVDAVYVVPVGDGCPTKLQSGVGQVVLAVVHGGYTCSSMMRIAYVWGILLQESIIDCNRSHSQYRVMLECRATL